MQKFIITILASMFLISCFGLIDNGSDNIVDDYEVIWIDVHESRTIAKGEELIPAYVFAVGHNSKYIYAKQHPLLENSEEKIDREKTNYYIIERTKNTYQDKLVFGPLNKIDFEKKCQKLEIKNVEFDLTYPTKLFF